MKKLFHVKLVDNGRASAVVEDIAIRAVDVGFNSHVGQIGHIVVNDSPHCCDISSELCCPVAKPRR